VAAVIRHLYLITDQHTLMLESLRRRVERLEEGRAPPTPDTRREPISGLHLDGEVSILFRLGQGPSAAVDVSHGAARPGLLAHGLLAPVTV
jgi:hypothetical protein